MEPFESIKRALEDPKHQKIAVASAITGLLAIVIIVAVIMLARNGQPQELFIDTVASPIATRVSKIEIDAPYYTKKIRSKTTTFYQLTKGKTKWLEYRKPNNNYDAFVKAVAGSAEYGLNPEHYNINEIEAELEALYDNRERTPEEIAALDIKITASFFLFTTHMIEGRIRQAGYGDFIWKKNVPREDDIQLLIGNSSGDLKEILDKLHPPHEQYEKLRKALAEYRKFESSANLVVPASMEKLTIKPGAKNSKVPLLRNRLMYTDLKKYSPEDSLVYDEEMQQAVKQFQKRHGLPDDGVITPLTMKFLNQSFKEKADLIELNIERIRWLPHDYGDYYITINVPEYMLRVYQKKKNVMEMRVVLGAEFTSTPIFNDTLEYIVFSPTWNIPVSILKNEMLPKLKDNPLSYDPERFKFYQNGKEIHPDDIDWKDDDLKPEELRIVENPGEANSLGQVKFIMPNDFNVYLHDTPAEALFNERKRAFSHGCIRLEKPAELAGLLLVDHDKWDDKKIREAMGKEEPTTVHLKTNYHVEIEYRTVWVDEDGVLQFREDIYGHDKRQLAMLNHVKSQAD